MLQQHPMLLAGKSFSPIIRLILYSFRLRFLWREKNEIVLDLRLAPASSDEEEHIGPLTTSMTRSKPWSLAPRPLVTDEHYWSIG